MEKGTGTITRINLDKYKSDLLEEICANRPDLKNMPRTKAGEILIMEKLSQEIRNIYSQAPSNSSTRTAPLYLNLPSEGDFLFV